MKVFLLKFYFFLWYLLLKKYSEQNDPPAYPRKIALVMCKWIGDTFWDMQVIPALRKRYPDAEIHVFVKPFSKFLFDGGLPGVQIHVSSQIISDCRREEFSLKQWKMELAEIRALQADLLFDFTETPFSAVFASLSRAKFTVGYDHLGRFSSLYMSRRHAEYGLHLSRRPMALIGEELEFPQVVPEVSNPATTECDVMIFPGTGWKTKEYPAEKYHRIAKTLSEKGYSICIAGSPKEKVLCETVGCGLDNVKILTGSPDDMLRGLASAKVCLSGDTGPAHLAAAMGLFTVALFCGTNPLFCGPQGKQIKILRSSCPEAPKHRVQFCPADRRYSCSRTCFMDIEPGEIIGCIEQQIIRKSLIA